MKKTEEVFYVDPQGREHKALVTALNGLNAGYISIVYIDGDAPENENIRRVYDIPHFKDSARKEVQTVKGRDVTGVAIDVKQGNENLPDIHLNCWKELGEEHTAPASDHPMFDHPFAEKAKDEFGRVLESQRPEYDAQVEASTGYTRPAQSPSTPSPHHPQSVGDIEQMKSNHAGHLEGLIAERLAAEAKANPQPLPSAEDLDATAEEDKAKEATNGKGNGSKKPVPMKPAK